MGDVLRRILQEGARMRRDAQFDLLLDTLREVDARLTLLEAVANPCQRAEEALRAADEVSLP